MKRPYWWLFGAVILFVLVAVGLRIGRDPNVAVDDASEAPEEVIPGLTLRDVSLEQQTDEGQLLWKVDAAEVTYSPDQEVANLIDLEGELYEDGQLLYRVSADKGIIRDNGQIILLEDNITATGIQNQMVLKGQNLEWTPEDSILIVRNGLTGVHPQLRAKANEARIYDSEKRMEFEGDVVATTIVEDPQVEPWFKLQGETLQWKWEEETFDSDQELRVERFQNAKVTEVLVGQKSLVELAENRVTITENVNAQLLEVPLSLTSDQAVWEIEEQLIQADGSVRVVEPKQQVTVTSQQGTFNLEEQVARFTQDVLAIGQRNSSRLTSNSLTWNLEDQTVLAEGNVNYQQLDPQVKIQGPRARGRIEEQTVVIDGGQVVTEIVPDVQ
ncbi:LPS export ABC transporter periplasmic protein LptC [Oscillatoria sp. CS-180]|uniref:LPS export ABC transporter periplasmic protein LptC n=1 Tax=Oscillatoria sp. CS-180 TaxID=3021720 RepID=UPI00232DBF9B|nr:LPS export ABC transporter periplasmic protein LptC [Oscillatoria sp. CS-180]MDB9525628.1 LPS export ABC transporter periplasmic protein LptC [Oscillatoria sp. CS-180]